MTDHIAAPDAERGDDFTRSTGQWIKRYRHAAKMTQIELARALSKTQATISRWEAGQDAMLITDIEHLADLFRRKGLNPEPPPALAARHLSIRIHGNVTDGGVILVDPDRVRHVAPPEGFGDVALAAYCVETDALPVLTRGTILFAEQREAVDNDGATGALAVVATPERGTLLGVPRATRKGRVILERPAGRCIETDATAIWPVRLILPAHK
jgi:DNA-binding XRE family transcriptional regulator